MPYYCKKCGAVVSGKFCSCCGARATSGLEDFNRELRRRAKKFKSARNTGQRGFIALHAADFAWFSAQESIFRSRRWDLTTFSAVSESAYALLPLLEEKAAELYDRVMADAALVL